MKYATEIASGDMIFIPSFMKINSGIQKLLREVHIYTQKNSPTHVRTHAQRERERASCADNPAFIFFKMRGVS
jgi:hypothetical protein